LNVIVLLVLGWNLALIIDAARARKGGWPIWPTIVSLGAAWLACGFWNVFQDYRPVGLLLPILMVGIAAKPKSLEVEWCRKVMRILAGLVKVGICYRLALPILMPFALMRDSDALTAAQPNGYFDAVIINHDGITFGYDYLSLRPNHFDFRTVFDWPDRWVAEFVLEQQVTGMHWDSPTQLTVMVKPGTEFEWKKGSWQGVHIRFVEDISLLIQGPPVPPNLKTDGRK
jgi:hypothetical protein